MGLLWKSHSHPSGAAVASQHQQHPGLDRLSCLDLERHFISKMKVVLRPRSLREAQNLVRGLLYCCHMPLKAMAPLASSHSEQQVEGQLGDWLPRLGQWASSLLSTMVSPSAQPLRGATATPVLCSLPLSHAPQSSGPRANLRSAEKGAEGSPGPV